MWFSAPLPNYWILKLTLLRMIAVMAKASFLSVIHKTFQSLTHEVVFRTKYIDVAELKYFDSKSVLFWSRRFHWFVIVSQEHFHEFLWCFNRHKKKICLWFYERKNLLAILLTWIFFLLFFLFTMNRFKN